MNFDFVDNCDLDDYHVDNEDDEEEMYENNAKKVDQNSHQVVMDSSFHSTPSKTRSGRIYAAAIMAKAAQAAQAASTSQGSPAVNAGSSTEKIKKSKLPTPDLERPRELNLLQKDLHEAKLNHESGAPPPLNYSKR